jgi:hypothetical protein
MSDIIDRHKPLLTFIEFDTDLTQQHIENRKYGRLIKCKEEFQ